MKCQCCGLEFNLIHGIEECPACIGSQDPLNIIQISEVFGINKVEIRKIQASAMLKLFNQLGELSDYRQD